MKKFVFVLILAVIITGSISAQEFRHWLSGEVSLIGVGARYEFMLNEKISIGATAYWHSFFFFWNSAGIQATGRYYFLPNGLYGELGAGFGTVTNFDEDSFFVQITGFMITPTLGWKIDIGKPGGFYINPMIAVPIVLGKTDYEAFSTEQGNFKVGYNVRPAIGFGYAF